MNIIELQKLSKRNIRSPEKNVLPIILLGSENFEFGELTLCPIVGLEISWWTDIEDCSISRSSSSSSSMSFEVALCCELTGTEAGRPFFFSRKRFFKLEIRDPKFLYA